MIKIKNEKQIALMRDAGNVLKYIFKELESIIKMGISTKEVNDFVEKIILEHKMYPSFKGYNDFPAAACISVNEAVVHGIPKSDYILEDGDIVSVDIGATNQGYIADAARTYEVGEVSEIAKKLVAVSKDAFFEGIKYACEGERLGSISAAIEKTVKDSGFSIVEEFVGHGVGRELHEDPKIPNYGQSGTGPKLSAGMTLAIEPMINEGGKNIEYLSDNWTAVTKDGKLSAHYENTIVIRKGEPEIITL
ncbi:MAG: type I methionyl aminopeptidase [Clostridiales Family XIII bacterium]|jgi:methionyl aminopeptidase|nr:type I methionyl aminopeptidase [Clostridiales Family XIII bacterium]